MKSGVIPALKIKTSGFVPGSTVVLLEEIVSSVSTSLCKIQKRAKVLRDTVVSHKSKEQNGSNSFNC